jgi:hypothetical protein
MRRGHWMGLLFLCGCASPNVERQSLGDGSWRVKCKFGLQQCVQEVEKICTEPTFQIAGGSSVRKLYGVEPGKTEVRTSELTVTCGRSAVEQAEAKAQVVDAGAPAADGAPARASSTCTPGATQPCLGPGACAGAQACRADGSGFTACDCGAQTRPPGSDAGVADASSIR